MISSLENGMGSALIKKNENDSGVDDSSSQEKSLCLMFQADSFQFIVPRIQIAEVVRYGNVNFSDSTDQGITLIDWRNMKIPLISTSLINSGSSLALTEESKIILLHGLLKRNELPYYALAVNQSPRLLEVQSDTIVVDESVETLAAGEFVHVTVDGEKAVIPKFEYIEKYILDALS